LAPGRVLCHWFDFEGQKSSLFYILGAQDEENVPTSIKVEEGEEPTEE